MARRRRKAYGSGDFLRGAESLTRSLMKGQRKRPSKASGGMVGCVTGLIINGILLYLLWRFTCGLH